MIVDREKVIKGLEICSDLGAWHGLDCEHNKAYKDCPYRGCETGCVVTIAKDAIELLKEQEAKRKPVSQIRVKGYRTIGYCPSCGRGLDSYVDRNDGDHITHYCYNCGQAVKWEKVEPVEGE